MSSKSRSKAKPRLSMAMDVDPTTLEEHKPASAPTGDPSAEESVAVPGAIEGPAQTEQGGGRTSTIVSRPRARRAPPVEATKQGTTGLPPDLEGDPAIHVINGRLYVQVGEDLMPEGARVQMTFALTALERHRWLRYAEANNLTLVEVLRRAIALLLD